MEMMRSTTKQHDWHGKNIWLLLKYVIHENKYLVSWMETAVWRSDKLQNSWSEITLGHVYTNI